MRNAADRIPEIIVAPEVYDAILLAERAVVVTQPKVAGREAGRLPDFFAVRRCLLTAGADAGPAVSRAGLHLMVGG